MRFTERLLDWLLDELLFAPGGDAVENLERSLDLIVLGETDEMSIDSPR